MVWPEPASYNRILGVAIMASEGQCNTLGSPAHLVQFYQANEALLARNVARYLREGLEREEGLLVIATPDHREAFARELGGTDMPRRRVVFIDAEETLAPFVVDGHPDWSLFESAMGAAVREARARAKFRMVRAYGEMVGVLWEAEQFSAAVRVEQFWNRLLETEQIQLFCGYPVDIFGREFRTGALDGVLAAHSHIESTGGEPLERAIDRAMDEVLGPSAEGLKLLVRADLRPTWAVLPRAEATILWLRNNLPEHAEAIIARARDYCPHRSRDR